MRPIDAGYAMEAISRHRKPTPVGQYGAAYNDGINAAIQEILLAPTLAQPSEALTWNELGAMVGKPVYIVYPEEKMGDWALVRSVRDARALFISAIDPNDYGDRELYGETWLAYRRPPEGEKNT